MGKRIFLILLSLSLLLTACGQAGNGSSDNEGTWQESFDLGVRYLSEGNYSAAVLAFSAAIEIDPKRAEAYTGRGQAYMKTGADAENLSAAQADFETALDIDQKQTDAWLGLADIFLANGDYARAQEILQQGVEATGDASQFSERMATVQSALTIDSATYATVPQEFSYADNNGQELVHLTYDLVQLDGDSSAIQEINEELKQRSPEIFDAIGGRNGLTGELMVTGAYPGTAYQHYAASEVRYNKNGIISILITYQYVDDAETRTYYSGFTFDLNSGMYLNAADLIGTDEATAKAMFEEITSNHIFVSNYFNMTNLLEQAVFGEIQQYALNEYRFFIDSNGEIVLLFDPYQMTSEESLVLQTEIPIQKERNDAGNDLMSILSYTSDNPEVENGSWHSFDYILEDGIAFGEDFTFEHDKTFFNASAIPYSDTIFKVINGTFSISGNTLSFDGYDEDFSNFDYDDPNAGPEYVPVSASYRAVYVSPEVVVLSPDRAANTTSWYFGPNDLVVLTKNPYI